MKVLVLGGAGFIGPRVMRRILERGHDVACMDVNTNSPTIAALATASRCSVATSPLSTTSSKAMVETKPDRVLNLAYLLGPRSDGVTGEQDPHWACA